VVSSSTPSRANRVPRAVLALLALGLASACGNGSNPGVTVTNAQSDVVFGNKPPATAPPVGGNGGGRGFTPSVPGSPVLDFDDSPPLTFGPNEPRSRDNTFQPARTTVCPGPPLFATAPKAATTSVEGQPKEGYHLWQLITSEDLGNNIKKQTAKYTNYQVRNVSKVTSTPNPQGSPTTVFTYDIIAPIGKGGIITTTIQVKQNAPSTNVTTGNVGNPRRVSEPDAGVAIKKQVEKDAEGKVVGSFTPATAVLILPLPIAGGAEFTGTGTDPTTGGFMTVRGVVKGPQRITGCTTYVQGYAVEATVTSSGATGQAEDVVTEVFTIETQSGGLLIGTAQQAPNSKLAFLSLVGDPIARLDPKPIPKDQAL